MGVFGWDYHFNIGFPGGSDGKKKICLPSRKPRFDPWVGELWRRAWQPTPVFLPGKSHGQRSLVGCSLWGREESDTTEWLHFHFSFSCTGEGNGDPLQCSCLENPRDGGAWWAAVSGVAQSRTRLKWISSSSSSQGYLGKSPLTCVPSQIKWKKITFWDWTTPVTNRNSFA